MNNITMNNNIYIPGQGLLNFISDYTSEAPSPAPIPNSTQAVVAEPADSRCWENEKLKEELKSMKQEMKVLKSMCGLDRRLKLTKIEEEDLHKYYRGDLKSLISAGDKARQTFMAMGFSGESNKDTVILNKSLFDLEFSKKDNKSYPIGGEWCDILGRELKDDNIIPSNGVMVDNLYDEDCDVVSHLLSQTGGSHIITLSYGPIEYELDHRGDVKKPYSIKRLTNNNSIAASTRRSHDINEWFKMNITFPKLPDFMKIENMNTIEIDIYKMKGIYIITYE